MIEFAELKIGLRQSLAELSDPTSLLHLDRLTERITQVISALEACEELAAERTALRSDYEQRIGGMLKAMAVADRTADRIEESVALAQQLQSQSAEELLVTYRKVSARFRDLFRASYTPHTNLKR